MMNMPKTKLNAIGTKPRPIFARHHHSHTEGIPPVDGFPRHDEHILPITETRETDKPILSTPVEDNPKGKPLESQLKRLNLRKINEKGEPKLISRTGEQNGREQISRSLDSPHESGGHIASSKLDKIEEHRKLSRLPRGRNSSVGVTANGKTRRKSSHELLNSISAASKKTLPEATHSVHELVINDEAKARENDRIIQDRMNEAKALSRKNEGGSDMHTFSLWSKKIKTPILSSKDDSEDFLSIAPPKHPSRHAEHISSSHINHAYVPSADYIIGLPEDEERPAYDQFKCKGGRMAELLRQAVAASNVSDSDSLGSQIKYAQSNESVEEVDDLYSRQNEADSVCSIEEEEEVRAMPVRRRSYSEGELGQLTRHFSSEEIQNLSRYRSPSPALSEISRESIEVASAVSMAVSKAVSSDDGVIDFSDSTMKWYVILHQHAYILKLIHCNSGNRGSSSAKAHSAECSGV